VQASISAETAPWDGKRSKLKGIRKIHPSQPPGVSPNIQARIPPAVAAAAHMPSHNNSSQDSVKEKLQEAFLEQYSGAGHKARHHWLTVSSSSLLHSAHCTTVVFTAGDSFSDQH